MDMGIVMMMKKVDYDLFVVVFEGELESLI